MKKNLNTAPFIGGKGIVNFLPTKLIRVLKETRLNMSMRSRLNWNLEGLVLRRGKNQST